MTLVLRLVVASVAVVFLWAEGGCSRSPNEVDRRLTFHMVVQDPGGGHASSALSLPGAEGLQGTWHLLRDSVLTLSDVESFQLYPTEPGRESVMAIVLTPLARSKLALLPRARTAWQIAMVTDRMVYAVLQTPGGAEPPAWSVSEPWMAGGQASKFIERLGYQPQEVEVIDEDTHSSLDELDTMTGNVGALLEEFERKDLVR